MPAIWASSSGRKLCPDFRLRPPRHVTSWFCRRLIGRPLQSSLPQAGTAFRQHPQTTRSRQKRRDAGARPKPIRKRQHGLRATARTSNSQVLPWSGVMVLLSPRIPAKSLRWKEHAAGRALEVRFDWQGARVTVVAVYQHVWSPAKTVHNRASLLKALGRCIKQVPHRDTLILAGDYNSSLTKQPRLVGAATSPRESRPDEPELSNFLGNHRLVALNTWQPSLPTLMYRETSAPR